MKAIIEIQGLNQFMEEALDRLVIIQQELDKMKASQQDGEYLSVTAVAKHLGVSTSKIRMMFHEGVLDGKQSTGGRKIMISRESLVKYEEGPIPKLSPIKRL